MRGVMLMMVGLLLVAVPLFIAHADESTDADSGVTDNAGIDGGTMFAARCSLCHQLPEPGMLKIKQWGFIIETMQLRMQQANMPPLNDQEKKIILEFLSEHAR